MQEYSLLRQFADSWMLLAMFAFLIGCYIWAFLPSQKGAREDASQIPFRNDISPSKCKGTCADCASAALGDKMKGLKDV